MLHKWLVPIRCESVNVYSLIFSARVITEEITTTASRQVGGSLPLLLSSAVTVWKQAGDSTCR